MTLPNLFLEPSLTQVAAAVAWTGIVSTSLNFFIEITAQFGNKIHVVTIEGPQFKVFVFIVAFAICKFYR